MDPLDHLGALHDGIDCTVCDERVPADRIRLLARRDDLVFLQLDCPACGSTSLGFIADRAQVPEADRLAGAAPISPDDVLDMHDFLASWDGDLSGLLRPRGGPRAGHVGPGARRARRSA